ncbi:hypothetical protein AB7C87_11205 [Natrarchaeobius sp. A-rgal3]|uniref:hypothetical protein n=1 Tax=Natrarchaeobius versutus TaxID=1679078 RepID=UPI00350FA778
MESSDSVSRLITVEMLGRLFGVFVLLGSGVVIWRSAESVLGTTTSVTTLSVGLLAVLTAVASAYGILNPAAFVSRDG